MKKKETRVFNTELRVETRADGKPVIKGHAAVFDSLSENLGGFREQIRQGAFDDVLDDDVRALLNHDSNYVLGRTKAGNLSLSVDSNGLAYDIDPVGDRSYDKDLLESLERKDITQSSFGFTVDEDKWEEDDDGRLVRTIVKVKRLYDVSPVTFPAYPDTDVAKRSMDKYKESKKEEKEDPSGSVDISIDMPEDGNYTGEVEKDGRKYKVVVEEIREISEEEQKVKDTIKVYQELETIEP